MILNFNSADIFNFLFCHPWLSQRKKKVDRYFFIWCPNNSLKSYVFWRSSALKSIFISTFCDPIWRPSVKCSQGIIWCKHNFKIKFKFVKHFLKSNIYWLALFKAKRQSDFIYKKRSIFTFNVTGFDTHRFDKKINNNDITRFKFCSSSYSSALPL